MLKTLFNFFFVLNTSLRDHKLKALDVVLANVFKHGLHSLDFIPINIHDLESIENLSFSFIKQDWFTAASNILQCKCACLEAHTGL